MSDGHFDRNESSRLPQAAHPRGAKGERLETFLIVKQRPGRASGTGDPARRARSGFTVKIDSNRGRGLADGASGGWAATPSGISGGQARKITQALITLGAPSGLRLRGREP